MSVGTIHRPSTRMSWTPQSPVRSSAVTSTAPGFIRAAGQKTPLQSSKALSPHTCGPRVSSPNYFEFQTAAGENPIDSDAALYSKQNGETPRNGVGVENGRQDSLRRQSETSGFFLTDGNLRHFSAGSGSGQASLNQHAPSTGDRSQSSISSTPKQAARENPHIEAETAMDGVQISKDPYHGPSFFDRPQMASPANSEANLTTIVERHARNSLPQIRPTPLAHSIHQRAETLPSYNQSNEPSMIAPQELAMFLKESIQGGLLLIDLRVFKYYSKSKIDSAINLNLPTTLLKRPSYNIHKLAQCFANKAEEKSQFDRWPDAHAIIVYDENSSQFKEATNCVHMLKKFTSEGFDGATYIVTGGFNAFSKLCPDQVQDGKVDELVDSNAQKLAINPPAVAPVMGGCMMPESKTAANPFFGTIRQNMDLIDGVGQKSIKLPSALREGAMAELPSWLKRVTDESDNGKTVADRFLEIERTEQKRMQKALTVNSNPLSPNDISIAGIELGNCNRYKDILPYQHSRVVLQSGESDYINASHLKGEFSHKQYLATQAPVPPTFEHFWRLIWEQKVMLIVMLTAETESGQRKGHNYWDAEAYGPFRLKLVSERSVSLEKDKPSRSFTSPLNLGAKDGRPSIGKRRSTNHGTALPPQSSPDPESDVPPVIIRKLTLTHTNHPFEPIREITQMHYSHWPDFSTAQPSHILGLVEHCDSIARSYHPADKTRNSNDSAGEDEAPIVVHCSAGCGRTGVFCVVDTVLDILKRQKAFRRKPEEHRGPEAMEIDGPDEDAWLAKDDTDLVAKTVADFRFQRLSMVQTLQQFVLCYESVLEWLVGPDRAKSALTGEERKSWAG